MWLTKAYTSQEAPTSIRGSSSLNLPFYFKLRKGCYSLLEKGLKNEVFKETFEKAGIKYIENFNKNRRLKENAENPRKERSNSCNRCSGYYGLAGTAGILTVVDKISKKK